MRELISFLLNCVDQTVAAEQQKIFIERIMNFVNAISSLSKCSGDNREGSGRSEEVLFGF